MKSDFLLPWDERTATLTYLDSVTEYSAEVDLDHIIAFTPDSFDGYQVKIDEKRPEEFIRLDNRGISNISAVDMADQTKKILLKYNSQFNAIGVNSASDLTANGTWSADTSGSDASNLTKDSLTFRKFNGALNFDVTVAQTANNFAQISNSTFSAVDLSDEKNVAHFVADVYIPDKTNLTSFTLRWGSDASNYFEKTVTTKINSGAFTDGWNVLDFNWASATETGTVDAASIDYLLFRVTYSASQANATDFRLNNIRAIMPENVTYRYTTAYIAKNSSGTFLDEIAATSDVVLFSGQDTKFMKAVISGCLFELFGDDNTKRGQKEADWEVRYKRDKDRLKKEYTPRVRRPEQRIKIRSTLRRGAIS
ncbi:MAG: hypothetical protein AAB456_04065 [Patescibacteria group bacterium]